MRVAVRYSPFSLTGFISRCNRKSPGHKLVIRFISYAVGGGKATSTMHAMEYFTEGSSGQKQVTYSLLTDIFAPGSIVNLYGPNVETFIVLPDGIVIIYYYYFINCFLKLLYYNYRSNWGTNLYWRVLIFFLCLLSSIIHCQRTMTITWLSVFLNWQSIFHEDRCPLGKTIRTKSMLASWLWVNYYHKLFFFKLK